MSAVHTAEITKWKIATACHKTFAEDTRLSTTNLQRWIFQKNVSLSTTVIDLHLIRCRAQSSLHKSFLVCSICTVRGWDKSALDTVYVKEKKYCSVKIKKGECLCATGKTRTSTRLQSGKTFKWPIMSGRPKILFLAKSFQNNALY